MRDFSAVERAVEQGWSEFGGLDSLVNNAAGNFLARTERLSPNAFAAVLGIVLQGSFHCTLALGRRWIDGGRPGRVLNILTTYASSGSPYVVPSASAKAGVLAMTRSLAVEWARYRIRLNAIAPGAAHAVYYADLSRLAEMKRVAGEIAAAEAKIDVLINNAGGLGERRPLTEVDDSLFDFLYDLNVRAVLAATQAAIPHFEKRGGGHLINVGPWYL